MVVGLAYALPAENPAKKNEPAPSTTEQPKLSSTPEPPSPAVAAAVLPAGDAKPNEPAAAADEKKKEALEPAETVWGVGWGGYGRGM